MIKIYDNFLGYNEFLDVIKYCKNSLYKYGEIDKDGVPPVGMVSRICKDDNFFRELDSRIKNKVSEVINLQVYRMYINLFLPGESPYFHTDNYTGVTCIYYANEKWDIDSCGETQFLINDEIVGILPMPNRLICFNSNLLHKATSFRDNHRFTIAIKYE